MQSAVRNLVELGPAPSSEEVSVEWLQNAESLVKTIAKPVSDDDARALAKLFGPDECFGFGWTVLHLIETAPGWPLPDVLAMPKNEWIERLKKRVENAKRFK